MKSMGTEVTHRFVETNGIRMHVAEQGAGPLVILCHGFPECWRSWRHQLPAIAAAGFRVVAPDQRGFGQTDCPTPVEAYNMFQLVGDIVGLVHALGEDRAILVGHDWGSPVAWYSSLLRPDMFRAVAMLSVPFSPRTPQDIRPTVAMRKMSADRRFYHLYYQEPGVAEREMEADVRRTLRMHLYSASGDAPVEERWRYMLAPHEGLLDGMTDPASLPEWLTEQDLDYLTAEYQRTGFRGGLNWYRNIDHRWEQTPFLNGATLDQPALFIAGDADAVITMRRAAFDNLERTVPRLTKKVLLPGAGHWVQQERPQDVNRLLLEFLRSL
jgi:pimeloyl-ACP methyl ester carboxylesterase